MNKMDWAVILVLYMLLVLGACQSEEPAGTASPSGVGSTTAPADGLPAGAPPPADSVAADLEVRLELPTSLPDGASVPLRVSVTNLTDEERYLLAWFTPLEDPLSEVFAVRLDGERLYFRGWVADRGDPTPADYVAIEPGGSVTTEIDLARYYLFTEAGHYEVVLLVPMFSHLAASEAEMARTKGELTAVPVIANTAVTQVAAGFDIAAEAEGPADSGGSQDCGSCPNPLVAMQLERDIEGDFDRINQTMDEFFPIQEEPGSPFVGFEGWQSDEQSAAGPLGKTAAWLDSGINALRFRQQNPCAQIIVGGHDNDPRNAKYVVTAKLVVEFGNGSVEVKHREDVTAGGPVGLKTVGRVGTMTVQTKLVALKNGETYDANARSYAWVEPAPWPQDYWSHMEPAISGAFGPGAVPTEYDFGSRDIGTTIRKKETPTSAKLQVDDLSRYPPSYLLELTDIRNEFDEPLPGFVRVALRVSEGQLRGGTTMDGWTVYSTQDGRIPVPVLYDPPQCPDSGAAKLEIAEVCDWHDGEPSPGKPRISMRIPLHQCTNWAGTFTVNYTREDIWTLGSTDGKDAMSYSATGTFFFAPDESGTMYWAQGTPGGAYNSWINMERTYHNILTGGTVGGSSQVCNCAGGYTITSPEEQSTLYIVGDTYDFALVLSADPDETCDATWKEWDALGNTQTSDTTSYCLFFHFDDCIGQGTFSGNRIQGQNTIEGEGIRLVCSWDFHRE
jgi:hypothetical protein